MTLANTDRQLTAEAAGELRHRLRRDGWSSDLGWAAIGVSGAVGESAERRRTVAYLASLRAVDGGARGVWKDGDLPVPAVADAREVYVAREHDSDWHSLLLESPPLAVEHSGEESEARNAA